MTIRIWQGLKALCKNAWCFFYAQIFQPDKKEAGWNPRLWRIMRMRRHEPHKTGSGRSRKGGGNEYYICG
nr:MAG TPA: hypothetical protein [Caudoviricetes sp.]